MAIVSRYRLIYIHPSPQAHGKSRGTRTARGSTSHGLLGPPITNRHIRSIGCQIRHLGLPLLNPPDVKLGIGRSACLLFDAPACSEQSPRRGGIEHWPILIEALTSDSSKKPEALSDDLEALMNERLAYLSIRRTRGCLEQISSRLPFR